LRVRIIDVRERGYMSNKDRDSDNDHGKAAAKASSGAKNVVPDTSGSRAAENPHIEAFKNVVARDPALQEQLATSTSDDHFAEQAVALGAKSGYHFTSAQIRAHVAAARAHGLAVLDASGDPETPQPPSTNPPQCTPPGYTHSGSCSWAGC
jgi:hypothetical protein